MLGKLADKLTSPAQVTDFLEKATVNIKVGKLGGRTFHAEWKGEHYSFKMNDLIKFVLSKTSESSRKEVTTFKTKLEDLEVIGENKIKELERKKSCIHKIRAALTRLKQGFGRTKAKRKTMLNEMSKAIADKPKDVKKKKIDNPPKWVPEKKAEGKRKIEGVALHRNKEPSIEEVMHQKIDAFGAMFQGFHPRITSLIPESILKNSQKLQQMLTKLNDLKIQLETKGVKQFSLNSLQFRMLLGGLIEGNDKFIADVLNRDVTPSLSIEKLRTRINKHNRLFKINEGTFNITDIIPDRYKPNKEALNTLLYNLIKMRQLIGNRPPKTYSKEQLVSTLLLFLEKVGNWVPKTMRQPL